MTAALTFFPPVIDQSLHRVPLDPWSVALFAGLTAASGYLAFRRSPWVGALVAFAVPFAFYRDIGQTTLTAEKCLILGCAVGLLASGAPLVPRSKSTQRILLAALFVLLAVALSAYNAVYLGSVVREFFKQVEYLVLLWVAATLAERVARSPLYFSYGVCAAGAIVATYALAQAVIGGAPSGMWVNGHTVPRVTGSLEGPNQLAGFLEATLPVLWVWPMIVANWQRLRIYSTTSATAALILTQSRAGILMAAVCYALLWRMRPKAARSAAVATITGAALGVTISIAWFVVWAHASWADFARLFLLDIPTTAGGVGTRAQLWPAALALFLRHPLVGVGAGNFSALLPTVGLHGIVNQAASLPLQTLAETGLVGVVALIAFAVVALRETFALRNTSPLALAAFLALVSLLAHQLVDDLFFFPKVASLCWLLLGYGTASEQEVQEQSPSERALETVPLAREAS